MKNESTKISWNNNETICVVINSKYTVFMSEEIIANYKIDMKENEKKP